MRYQAENEAKACFDDIYTSPTPHDYIARMARTGYEIGVQARPFCIAAAELLKEHIEEAWPVQMLDIGCSYGMGSAFVKYGCSFDEMVAFFSTRVPKDVEGACQAMRAWVNVTPEPYDIRCVGLDSSEPAIRFALKSALLDGGIPRDYEDPNVNPTAEERSWLRSCNLVISTGAIGYITDHTLSQVMRHAGKDHPSNFGPLAVLTILRMFEAAPIQAVFREHGYRLEKVPGVMLPQRRFQDEIEQEAMLKLLHDRGIDTGDWEDQGKQFAELYVGARPAHFRQLLDRMHETHETNGGEDAEQITYICR